MIVGLCTHIIGKILFTWEKGVNKEILVKLCCSWGCPKNSFMINLSVKYISFGKKFLTTNDFVFAEKINLSNLP